MNIETPNNGGLAFPRTADCVANENKDFDLNGMTLRDYFAAKAMTSLVTLLDGRASGWDWFMLSTEAYAVADAMLKAREPSK